MDRMQRGRKQPIGSVIPASVDSRIPESHTRVIVSAKIY
jgi:hypothetical protein